MRYPPKHGFPRFHQVNLPDAVNIFYRSPANAEVCPLKQKILKMSKEDLIVSDKNDDGIDRAGFIKCMAWAGTGILWMMNGGIMKSFGMSQMIDKATGGLKKGLIIPPSDFSFVQISDSHIGFNKPANPDVLGTLQAAVSKINGMPRSAFFRFTYRRSFASGPGR